MLDDTSTVESFNEAVRVDVRHFLLATPMCSDLAYCPICSSNLVVRSNSLELSNSQVIPNLSFVRDAPHVG